MIRANLGLLLSCFRDPWGVAFLFLGVVSDSASIKPTLAAWAGGVPYTLPAVWDSPPRLELLLPTPSRSHNSNLTTFLSPSRPSVSIKTTGTPMDAHYSQLGNLKNTRFSGDKTQASDYFYKVSGWFWHELRVGIHSPRSSRLYPLLFLRRCWAGGQVWLQPKVEPRVSLGEPEEIAGLGRWAMEYKPRKRQRICLSVQRSSPEGTRKAEELWTL